MAPLRPSWSVTSRRRLVSSFAVAVLLTRAAAFSTPRPCRGGATFEPSTSGRGRGGRSPVSPLRNVNLERVLEVELDEIEDELNVAKSKPPPGQDSAPAAPPMKATDAASIVAGTAIGGGFLALPSVIGPIGYLPSAAGLVAAWTFITLSACAFAEAAGLALAQQGEEGGGGSTSIAGIIRQAFGKKWAYAGSLAFMAQMLAVVTAQVVKGADIVSRLTGIPYQLGCLIPTFLVGWFAFASRPEAVEGANTALTAMMVGGFVALIAGTIAGGNVGQKTGALFARAEWSRLLPSTRVPWAMPVFINMLCYVQSMPLVIERMVAAPASTSGQSQSSSGGKEDEIAERTASLYRARSAALLGASIPLAMSVLWAAISTALIDPSSSNPIFSLLASGPAVAVPVGLLSAGAIGTTLIGAFLAMGHFTSDVICSKLGYCSLRWNSAANVATVAVPCVLACLGPGLYLPLLAFAGAYPTTLLYGLAPSLAAIVLRRRARKEGRGGEDEAPRLVPGGEPTMIAVAGVAIGLVGSCTALAARHTWLAFR